MKYRSLIFLIGCTIIFAGCDGRNRLHKTPKEVLQESKLLDSFSENTNYIPEEYTEIETDTILNNGFRVHIKTFSDMENSFLELTETESVNEKTRFREFKSDVTVFKDDAEIFHKTIDKAFFANQNESHELDLNLMTLLMVDVNQLPDASSNQLEEAQIEFYYLHTKRDYKLQYLLRIQPNGEFILSNFEN
ncbi:hypothetical protein BZARG_2651 [Bizionia argentinensis JUB59]|uniref:DUF4738 domain-containing protein n=1 Tax=Bizionia argentinensis JUB59 TaxID=1046627 RepID=G2EHN8_9FLAO|nr:hypothetical protein [Bizionia argentinensis]EGV42023.1 hypothetical protein BZARG_2651 [Bizionia argentinensis JUB59]